MALSLDPKPLVPLDPIQRDRQPTYPKVLGPVFVGTPYLAFPAAPSHTSPSSVSPEGAFALGAARLKRSAPEGESRAVQDGTGPSQTPSQASPRVQGGSLGSRLDLLA